MGTPVGAPVGHTILECEGRLPENVRFLDTSPIPGIEAEEQYPDTKDFSNSAGVYNTTVVYFKKQKGHMQFGKGRAQRRGARNVNPYLS